MNLLVTIMNMGGKGERKKGKEKILRQTNQEETHDHRRCSKKPEEEAQPNEDGACSRSSRPGIHPFIFSQSLRRCHLQSGLRGGKTSTSLGTGSRTGS
jgi:hypothetical protein